MFKLQIVFLDVLFLIVPLLNFLPAQKQSLNRAEIDDKYKWDLTPIYAEWDSWEAGMTDLESKMDEFSQLRGTLAEGPQALLHALRLSDDLNILSFRVYRLPQLTRDTDSRDQEIAAKVQRVQILFSKFRTATAWFHPEMLQIPWETMKTWLDETPGLAPYRFGIEDLYRQQAHVLDEDKEKLLSYFSQFRSTPEAIYSDLSTADIKYPEITLSNDESLTMTRGNYSRVLATNRNQADREKAFEAHYRVYKDNENSYAAIYNSVCQKDWADARARNYSSTLEAALEEDNVPVSVYENLVTTVKENSQPLQRYSRLRKKVLNLPEYHLYDGSISLGDVDKTYPYEEAQKWVLASVEPLGKGYQKKMETALSGGWIDVFENEGKRPGAYSANVYGVHPYMLLNYSETMRDVFTLGHELGHTMHTTLANENQPFATSNYTIFVAEVASTLNERLLLDYLLKSTDDPEVRVNLLQQAIDNIVGTFYTQVMFADFEWQAHRLVEEGQPITAATLNKMFRDLFTAYYGDALVFDDLYELIWARIPHFYGSPYYVYQYATCFASSARIYKNMKGGSKTERANTVENYLALLKSGGNDYPMNQLKKAGVDLTQPETIMAVVKQLDDMVSQLEVEINKL